MRAADSSIAISAAGITVGRDIATVTLVYKVRGREATGRQMQTWVRFPDAGWKVIAAHVSMITEQPVL